MVNALTLIIIASIPSVGSIGQHVVALQRQLKAAGFDPGAIDGIFGQKTLRAIIAFQKSKGLKPTVPGNLGPKTLAALSLSVVPVNPISGKEAITRDLKGRQDRHLHPTKRLEIENMIFPDGVIPACFVDEDIQACYSMVMRKIGERGWKEEGKNNYGDDVGEIQGTTGKFTEGGNGDAWCLDYGQMGIAIIEDFFQVESPVIGSAHCMTTFRAAAKIPGLVSTSAEHGTLALAKHGNTDSGHAMPVVEVLSSTNMLTSEGNTSVGNMRDGDGSGLKTRNQKKNGDLVTQGFVRLYPYNKLPKAS